MQVRYTIISILACAILGGLIAFFSPAKWISATLWVFAGIYVNGALADFEDAQPGGFDNPDGQDSPDFLRGWPAIWFWLKTLAIAATAASLGIYIQTS